MTEINKTYRIRTNVGDTSNNDYITLDANLVQDYDVFDILSVKIDSVDTYKLHNANYGVVVGRVLANNGFGVPNAKISIFIPSDGEDGDKVRDLYPFSSTASKNRKGVRYNLLPDNKVNDCHQIVGTFPNKRYALDNDVILEVFEKYYKYTVRTNNAGDYLIMGVPVGTHTLHMDLDLSDCGILSQRPRDFVYKGYTVEQFENPNMFKDGTNYGGLSQIFTQDQVVTVHPFWGNSSLGEKIGITRADINISFKFEPTCVFMGSVVSDNSSQGITKKCMATENMGNMEELTTGEGTIEMIRKTPGGSVEEFQVKGTQLIDGNGIWCYQIPMNLDYMMTDEYGNMVPTDNPEKGIPTRTRVRFRISMSDTEENVDNFFRAKVLVPHNPQNLENGKYEDYDYEFGTYTREDSFRDLFWNNVYSVKSYIPRFQKRKVGGWKDKKFTGIKNCNFYGSNNPIPYNNIRIKLPFIFTVMCSIIKIFIFVVSIINTLISIIGNFLSDLGDTYIGFRIGKWEVGDYPLKGLYERALDLSMNVIKDGLCPDLENWFFAPMFGKTLWIPSKKPPQDYPNYDLLKQTLNKIRLSSEDDDETSIDVKNNEEDGVEEPICLTIHTDYLISCVEMNLAMEYKVINFDFYNDWINGTLYFPRFMRYMRTKKTFLGLTFARAKIKGCMDDTKIFNKTRRYTQQCAIGYKARNVNNKALYTNVDNPIKNKKNLKAANNLHKQRGLSQKTIFGSNGGICHEQTTLKGQCVYYMKPCEWTKGTTPIHRKVNLYATDVILLGSLNDCDLNGIPNSFKYLSSTSYVMPTNLALTNMETNGYLYTGKGTVCTGKVSLTESDVKNNVKIDIMPPSCGLTAEILAYSGAQDFNYDVQYDGNELSDIIALTEAAGISWNYTGPGQGEEVPEKMYHPGGHFLGLSCVNSMTNIKSCINLSRICEIGANMSQRKEDITSIDKSGNIHYSYTVPSGFISGDDIVGEDFRAMFATMNYKRLIANRVNPNTGYKMYDMDFIKPINFDGAFKSVVTSPNSLYNKKIDVPKEDETIFDKIGISINHSSRDDYDQYESANTQTRTIEDSSLDYYLFRFGLQYEDLTKTNQKHLRRFLLNDGGYLYLPQFENSYYFYFGLKNGATALDEFNKQFYSECATGNLLVGEPSVNIFIDDDGIDMRVAKADITITTTNLETPFQYIEILSDVEFIQNENGEWVRGISIKNGDEDTRFDEWLSEYSFELSDCPFGTYTVTIMDANDVVYTKTVKVGSDLFEYNSEVVNFNSISYKGEQGTQGEQGNSGYGDYEHRGGYITVSDLKIDKLSGDTVLTVFVVDEKGSSGSSYSGRNEYFPTSSLTVDNVGEYKLMVNYQCDGNKVEFLLQTFTVKDNSSLKLFVGTPSISGCSKEMKFGEYYNGWWNSLSGDTFWLERVSMFNEETNRSGISSTIKTYAIGGEKMVWGCPQNNEKILVDKVHYAEDPEIQAGYSVDDEYFHYPTLKYNGNTVTPFSTIVYNNEMVMGDYAAYLSNGEITVNPYIEDSSPFISGCGYVFKPIPNGNLQFHIYTGSSSTEEDIKKNLVYDDVKDDEGNDIKKGVFYPSIPYHSIDRPFYANSNFFCWNRRAIEFISDEMGEITPTIVDYEEAGKTEMVIYNGITYDKKFFSGVTNNDGKRDISGSYITNYSGESISAEFFKNDMNGINNSKNRETEIYCFNDKIETKKINSGDKIIFKGLSGITSYGYNIIEGVSGGTFDEIEQKIQLVNSINDVIDAEFSDYVTYRIVTKDDGKKYIVGPIPGGGFNNNNVHYYLARDNFNNSGNMLFTTDGGFIYGEYGENTYVVLSTYTSAAKFNNEGGLVLLTIVFYFSNVIYSFPLKNENGVEEKNVGVVELDVFTLKEIFDKVFSSIIYLEGVRDNRLGYAKNTDWSNLLKRHTLPGDSLYDENATYYAYGVISGYNNTNLYKIYPTIVRVSEFKDDYISDISIYYNEKEYQSSDDSLSLTFNTSSGYSDNIIIRNNFENWVAEVNYNDQENVGWCKLYDCNYRVEIGEENGYYVSNLNSICVGVDNNSGEKRNCTISLNYKDENIRGKDIKIIIEQEGIEP